MTSPFGAFRKRSGLTKKELSRELGTTTRIISDVEDGRKRLPAKFYNPLEIRGEDPKLLAIQQEEFIKWRRYFHSCLRWGIPPEISRETTF